MAPEQPGFSNVLEGCSDGIRVLSGTLEPEARTERLRSELEIAIPGERAAAEITYQTADG